MKKCFNSNVLLVIGLIILILYLLCLIWIIKVYNNAKDEPNNRINYINDDIASYDELYTPGQFCYNHYESFLRIGVLNDFDIHMKKIREFSLALVITIFVIMGGIIFYLSISYLSKFLKCSKKALCVITQIISSLIKIATSVTFTFSITTSIYYFKSDFHNFDLFSDCEYLNQLFDKDYDFVFSVKNNYLKYFIVYVISLAFKLSYIILKIFIEKKKSIQ